MKITLFNTSTNTCIPCPAGHTDNKISTSYSSSSQSEGIGLGPNHLAPTRSENNGVGILAGIDYESLYEHFKGHTKHKHLSFLQDKKVIITTLHEVLDNNRFFRCTADIMLSRCIVYVKVVYSPNLYRMVGTQVIFSTYSKNGVNDLRTYILEGILSQLEQYSFTIDRVNHIIITIIPVKLNLLSKYTVDKHNAKETRKFIDEHFTSNTIIPLTVNPAFLGGELLKKVIDYKIVDVSYYHPAKGKVPITKVSLEHSFLFNNKLSNLSPEFKFYNVILNSRSYILGIHYLSNNSVRKIRISLSGLFLEDIVDTVLPSGKVKRVNNNSVLIMKDFKVIHHYKLIRFLPIKTNNNKKDNKNVSFTENPNIGVLDFETFQSDEGI